MLVVGRRRRFRLHEGFNSGVVLFRHHIEKKSKLLALISIVAVSSIAGKHTYIYGISAAILRVGWVIRTMIIIVL